MNYEFSHGKVMLTDYDSFDVGQTLLCGQCFRFKQTDNASYRVFAFNRVLDICQHDGVTELSCDLRDFEDIWLDYFDLRRDYRHIKDFLSHGDPVMRDAVEFAPGIRILNQDPWETLISFIISQNKQIPQIKQAVQNLCEKYGEESGGDFCFPAAERLALADAEGIMSCKVGFRAKYILDAARKVASGEVCVSRLSAPDTAALKESLQSIYGVGPKVSDCVLLFGFSRYEYFPTDVWVKRIMEHFYFGGNETPVNDIHKLAKEKYGEYAGFAQQYLFNYARHSGRIFKK